MAIELADNALTTLDDVKAYLTANGLDILPDDIILIQLINTVSSTIESFCSRSFGNKSYTERYRGSMSKFLTLKNYPITTVNSIDYHGDDLVIDEDYEVDLGKREPRQLYKLDGVWLRSNRNSFPTYTGTGESNYSIKINYEAGYILPNEPNSNLPQDLQVLAVELVKRVYIDRSQKGGSEGLTRYKDSNLELTKTIVQVKPLEFRGTLERDNPERSLLSRNVQRLSKAHRQVKVSRVHPSGWKREASFKDDDIVYSAW